MQQSLSRLRDRLRPHQLCPECDHALGADDINIQEGMALCPACEALTRLCELNLGGRTSESLLTDPPEGCSASSDHRGVILRASLRSIGGFLGALAIALFWNGIVSVFLLQALAGLYAAFVGPVPDWFPAPDMDNGRPNMNDAPMGVGATLFLCLFLVPFLVVGAGMVIAAIMSLLGKVEVKLNGAESSVSTGFGPFVWRSRFNADNVQSVKFGASRFSSEDGPNRAIKLTADKIVSFGSMLSEPKLNWLRAALREALFKPREAWRGVLRDV